VKDPNKRSQGGKQTKCIRKSTLRRKEQHYKRKETKESSNHPMVVKAWNKRRWKKENRKRPSNRLDVRIGYVKDDINWLHRRIYLFIY
jgi:hypothetical protein